MLLNSSSMVLSSGYVSLQFIQPLQEYSSLRFRLVLQLLYPSGHLCSIDQLPGVVPLENVALVLSSKCDQYYTVTPTACSCRSFAYRGGLCKHQRSFFTSSEASHVADPRSLSPPPGNTTRRMRFWEPMTVLAQREVSENGMDKEA